MGREADLAAVDLFLEDVHSGFVALLLEGDPGIGKTTIWREAQRRARERGALVLACRPSSAEAKLSFAALLDLLSPIEEAAFAELPPPQRDALDVALLRASPSAGAPPAHAVAAGFLALIRGRAAAGTVLLAIDDSQWLDPASRAVVGFAARRLAGEPVGLLCSVRVPPPESLVGDAVAEDRVRRQVLGPLSLAAIGHIIDRRLGRSLPRPLLARISQATAGNPFHALEIARLLIERGVDHVPGAELPVPDQLQALTLARIRRLPAKAREALLLASVLSSPDIRTVDPRALAPAEEAGIVSVRRDGRIEFDHPLFAAAAYRSVASARRRDLHHRAAGLVADPEQRARHLALGSDGPDTAVAVRLDEAAMLASLRGAPDAAAELAELAAEHTPHDARDERGARLVDAARFHADAGDLERAEQLSQEALALASADAIRAAALQVGAQLATRRSDFSTAAQLATTALELAGGNDRLRAGIELDLVQCTISLGDVAGAAVHARAAVGCAESAGEQGMVADALAVLTMEEFLAGRGADHETLERAVALEDPVMARSFVMRPRAIQGLIELWSGESAAAVKTLSAVHDQAVERGQEGSAPMLSIYLVWAALWAGDLQQASRFSERDRAAAALVGDAMTYGITLAASALVHAHEGQAELTRREAREALELFTRMRFMTGAIWPLWALGLAELADENPARVNELLGPLADRLAGMGTVDPALAMFLPDEIEALIALGELDAAERHLAPFERTAAALDRAWARAAAARCRAVLAAARGDRAAAFAAFERALSEHDRARNPFERARTLLLAGQVHRRYKRRGEARQALEQALDCFERIGAPSWAERTRRELARVGRAGGGGVNRDALTDTELRLAELAASGLSNREVADRAFVSVKTVEANLTRVYRKLGVRSRATLADALRARDRSSRSDAQT